MIVWTAILTHLCSLTPFGMPYLAGFAPFNWQDMQDVIYRAPFPRMVTRPHDIANQPRLTRVSERSGRRG